MEMAHVTGHGGTRYQTVAAVCTTITLLSGISVDARVGELPEAGTPPVFVRQSDLPPAAAADVTPHGGDAGPLRAIAYHTSSMLIPAGFVLQPVAVIGGRSAKQKAAGAAKGAFIGLLLGSYLGAKIEGSCGCDDPGLKGALFGAPIGAILGAIVGARFF